MKKNYLKEIIILILKKQKIKISYTNILDDVKNCNLLLYRGSTFAADALALGLKPFYLKLSNEIEIDSLWMFKDSFKEKIKILMKFHIKLLKLKK